MAYKPSKKYEMEEKKGAKKDPKAYIKHEAAEIRQAKKYADNKKANKKGK